MSSGSGKRRVGAAPAPVLVPSAGLEPQLRDKAAGSRHSSASKTQEMDDSLSPGNHHHGNDLMTPPEVLLQSALKEARHFISEKKAEPAIQCWVRATALSHIVHGEDHWEFAKCHIQLGKAYLELCDLPESALIHAVKGRDILLSPGGHVMSCDLPPEAVYHLAAAHCTVGRVLTAQRKYLPLLTCGLVPAEKSLLLAKRASEKYSRMPGGSTDVQLDLDIVSAMGRLYMQQQKNSLAKDSFKKAVELSKAAYGARNKDLIPLLKQLAMAEQQNGEAVRAVETAKEALQVAESSRGTDSEQTASTLTCLAQLQKVVGGPVEDLLQRAYSIYCTIHGDHHEKSISCKENLCNFLISRGDSKERAIPILKEVIGAKKVAYGNCSQEVAYSCELLGSVYLSQGKVREAEKWLVEARDICNSVFGPKHKDTTRISQTLEIIAGSSMMAQTETPKGLEKRPRFIP